MDRRYATHGAQLCVGRVPRVTYGAYPFARAAQAPVRPQMLGRRPPSTASSRAHVIAVSAVAVCTVLLGKLWLDFRSPAPQAETLNLDPTSLRGQQVPPAVNWGGVITTLTVPNSVRDLNVVDSNAAPPAAAQTLVVTDQTNAHQRYQSDAAAVAVAAVVGPAPGIPLQPASPCPSPLSAQRPADADATGPLAPVAVPLAPPVTPLKPNKHIPEMGSGQSYSLRELVAIQSRRDDYKGERHVTVGVC